MRKLFPQRSNLQAVLSYPTHPAIVCEVDHLTFVLTTVLANGDVGGTPIE
jgi:hypothetical protein